MSRKQKAIAVWLVRGDTGEYETFPWIYAAFANECDAQECADGLNRIVSELPEAPERGDEESNDDYNARWCDWHEGIERTMLRVDSSWSLGAVYSLLPIALPSPAAISTALPPGVEGR